MAQGVIGYWMNGRVGWEITDEKYKLSDLPVQKLRS